MVNNKAVSGQLRSDERGIYFVLVAIVLAGLLTMVGLGIDGSRLYVNGLRQQRAADAAALSGAYYIGGAITSAQIRTIAENVARDNFDRMGVDYDPANLASHFQISYDPNLGNEVSVATSAPSESFIIGKVVPGSDSVPVAAASAATRVPLAVLLVIDTTGSMSEKTEDGEVKMDLLKDAAARFVDRFDPERDRVGVVAYSFATVWQRQNLGKQASLVLYPIAPNRDSDFYNSLDSRNYDPQMIKDRINTLEPEGWTSIHAGLLESFREMLRVPLIPNDPNRKKVIVIVTDGAPNRDQRPNSYDSGDGGLPEDLEGFPKEHPSDPDYPPYPSGCPADPDKDEFRDAFVEALITADMIRKSGITLMTMAIGDLDPKNDPDSGAAQTSWGTLGNHTLIKSTFMRRLANDVKAAQNQQDLDFPAECIPGYQGVSALPGGLALVSDDPNDFDAFLQEIANTILLRLTA